ncbi:hypothetical protein ZHAS_00007013 [Anopheles sinensis]|uniref:Uncharacterized protein n=1 Tax=Anopheles sinensis TaxID=74873 RepID=A0A084VNN3_ANOSI|nr:hypothetical protein ZHAS_00007013 [Anopheles sinensis]
MCIKLKDYTVCGTYAGVIFCEGKLWNVYVSRDHQPDNQIVDVCAIAQKRNAFTIAQQSIDLFRFAFPFFASVYAGLPICISLPIASVANLDFPTPPYGDRETWKVKRFPIEQPTLNCNHEDGSTALYNSLADLDS